MQVPLWISAAQLRQMLLDENEVALLDVREEGVFGKAHLLYASCAPLSRLEQVLPCLVPRRGCRIVFCEESDRQALQAARLAREFGYDAAFALRGGHQGALDEGFELFSGVNVPSKAFGEYIESSCRTPSLSASELQVAVESGEDLVILDSRPLVEYTVRNIPGGISCPGADLVYRVFALAPDPRTRVIVNCAGRTRSIIGAQSLINAGIPNSVMALRNGTMGWHLAGFPLEEGTTHRTPGVADEALAKAQQAAHRVLKNFQVQSIDDEGLRQWREQSDHRTLYVFDVRNPEEYLRGHLPGSRCAPGGQLIQETDQFMAAVGARVVLIDDDGVRATLTASWLLQMGWSEVRILQGGIGDTAVLETGAEVMPSGPGRSLHPPVDRYQRPYEKDWGDEQAMRDYLSWEVALVPKLKRDGTALFLRGV